VSEYLPLILAIALLLLALDLVDVRWGDDSRHKFRDRNW